MNENRENTENVGELIISEDVVAAITINAVKDIEGIAGFSQRGPDVQLFSKISECVAKSVKVWMTENEISLKIYIIMKEGYKIPTVISAAQKSVKNAVQSMTGKVVSKVDVHVSSLELASEETE